MMKARSILFGTMFAAAFAVPATADYVRLGSVDVGYRSDTDTAYSRFGGRMETLRLTASRSDIFCRSVIVQFENGERQNVFSGRLDERRPVDVDLRGRARRVDSIRFACRSDEFRGGQVYVEGDVGRYRDEWRHDRDWDRLWAGLLGMDRGPGPDRRNWSGPDRQPAPDRDSRDDRGPRRDRDGWGDRGPREGGDWIPLGRQSFEGRNDKESTFADWGGRHVDRIALRPIETDARCMSIVATFDSGRKVKLADGRVLERGRLAIYDLPGDERNVRKVYLRCRADDGYRVTIEILARK